MDMAPLKPTLQARNLREIDKGNKRGNILDGGGATVRIPADTARGKAGEGACGTPPSSKVSSQLFTANMYFSPPLTDRLPVGTAKSFVRVEVSIPCAGRDAGASLHRSQCRGLSSGQSQHRSVFSPVATPGPLLPLVVTPEPPCEGTTPKLSPLAGRDAGASSCVAPEHPRAGRDPRASPPAGRDVMTSPPTRRDVKSLLPLNVIPELPSA